MTKLTPNDGETWCPIIAGSFDKTYDGSTLTACGFKPSVGTCLCMWYWDSPVNLNALELFTTNYHMSGVHELYMIQGRVNGSWVVLSTVRTNLNHNAWHRIGLTCDNCTGIMIALEHSTSSHEPWIREVRIDYEAPPPEEGEADITHVEAPSEFTPNVQFLIDVFIKNVGETDELFVRILNTDTGETLDEAAQSVPSGHTWMHKAYITLTQTTVFHGRIEAGHEETTSTRKILICQEGYCHV